MQANNDELRVPLSEAGQIIAAHDGDVALLWLYLRTRAGASLEDAARALCRTRAEMEAALEKLQRMELVPPSEKPAKAETSLKLPPPDELPEYTAKDVTERSREDPRFAALLGEAKRVMGRGLSSVETKKLFGIYDYLALPPEVIMMLLNYCVSLYPTGDPPSMRQIEKEGYVWANREILTIEQAEAYIADSRRRRDQLSRVAKLLGITGRGLSPTETKHLTAWLDMGFDEEMIELALDRTITNTGALKWGYMNGILKSWHEKGLRTPEDVRDRDTRRPKESGKPDSRDMDRLLKDLDRI